MTCREKLKIEHPECVNERYPGGCKGCPDDYGYMYVIGKHDCDIIANNYGCGYCWDQEVMEGYKDERDITIEKLTRMIESKNGLIGTLKETTQKAKDEVAAKEDYCHEMEIDLLDKIRKLSAARRENRVLISINEILCKRLKDLGEEI